MKHRPTEIKAVVNLLEQEHDDVDPEDIYSDPDDCQHTFHPVGMSDYGTVYECSKCGGLTP